MAFEPELTEREAAIAETARRFAAEEVAPHAARWEKDRVYPAETQRRAADAGLTGLLVPESEGGHGLSLTGACRVFEELAAACMPFAFGLIVHDNLMGNIARNGSEAQRRALLPDMLACRSIGTFLLTEPGMGSDATAVACRAVADDGGWRLEGEKAWISSAAHADVLSVYAQADPEQGWRGVMCFLVQARRPGVSRVGPYDLAGGHALGAGGFRFDGVRLTEADILLPQERAFRAAMSGIDAARIFVGGMSVGMMRASLDRAVSYVKERQAFGRRIADFQGVQWMLADVETDLEASRLLTYRAAALVDAGQDATRAAAHAKKFATRAALQRIADCMQVMGANGLRLEEPAARHLASAKISQYIDGATEIQNVVLARALLGS
ncbi:MAG: hypothetical protein TEF_15025 [Rhizobiales bacterium NRL2]|jgi:alkylation response protein AidB-like acyl-CoA dehydrogenase|nr:MAG: hypothetical protein TEF_15025 [Rhizobiales bacterium NRL2]